MTVIRPERPGDEAAIAALTTAAFAPMPYSRGAEAAIIAALRADGDLALSLVAERAEALCGHVALSPLPERRGWFALGPVSVAPDCQGQGIGGALIRAALGHLRGLGAAGCALIGNPAYYARFGFVSDGRLTCAGLDPALVQHLTFYGPMPEGALQFAPAFAVDRQG